MLVILHSRISAFLPLSEAEESIEVRETMGGEEEGGCQSRSEFCPQVRSPASRSVFLMIEIKLGVSAGWWKVLLV